MTNNDWMRVVITTPPEVGAEVLRYLREHHSFHDVDWCVLERLDFARVDFDPCPPLTRSHFDS